MIAKALSSLFSVIEAEAASNSAFASRLEDALGKFAESYGEHRRAERAVEGFHPFIEFRKGSPEDFRARLNKFGPKELRLIVDAHNLGGPNALSPKAGKKALVEHIALAAQKRVERDAKLFEY